MKFEKDIKIILSSEIINLMENCVETARPNEACGIIYGEIKQVEKNSNSNNFEVQYISKEFNCVSSNRKSPVAFLVDDTEALNQCYEKAHQLNLRFLSIFHSHPAGAHPSGVDLDNMKFLDEFNPYGNFKPYKNLIWIIMDAQNKELNGFIYFKNEIMKIDVQIDKK